MPRLNPVTIAKSGGLVEVSLHIMPSWEDFDKVVLFLIENYKATSVGIFDGPDSRKCIMRANNVEVIVLHDDSCGNTIIASATDGNSVVMQIGEDLKSRLSRIESD